MGLNEYDKLEWWDICKSIKPELTWEEYEEMYKRFCELKERNLKDKEVN